MPSIKFSSNLFLGQQELNRFQYFLKDQGYQKHLLEDSVNFGLIKSNFDISFANGLVQADSNIVSSGTTFNTIKINPLNAIDSNGNFITQSLINNILIPGDSNWYWIMVQYAVSNIEQGTYSIDASGNLIGTNSKMTSILRGSPNIMSRVRFPNSTLNTGDYDILSVTNDTQAVLNGASFQVETGLQMAVVGSFTYGAAVLSANQLIFNYDGCTISLIPETGGNNVQPTSGYTNGLTFFLARVKSSGTSLIIQDKRTQYWDTKGANLASDLSTIGNPLVGIESIKYNTPFSPGDKNIVQLGWSFRSNNWAVNTNTNTLTIGSGLGGKYKSNSDFTNGDFNGWRVYYQNGKHNRVVSSTLSGTAINLTLDFFDVNNLSNDGGTTFLNSQYITVVPNAEEIEFLFTPNSTDAQPSNARSFTFLINELYGIAEVEVYNSPSVLYNVQYRYKNLHSFTSYLPIPSDTTHGYYTESSFDSNNNLNTNPANITYYTYTSSTTLGFIQLNQSPNAYKNFISFVNKGDLIGYTSLTTLPISTTLTVGVNNNYVKISGSLSLSNNTVIVLSGTNAVNGNNFKIHFNCTTIALNGYTLNIVDATTSSSIKNITQADIYQMLNMDGGLIFTAVYGGAWNITQNYDLGQSNQVIDIYNSAPNTLFNSSTGMGQVKGYYGWTIADSRNGSPNLTGMFVVGYNPSDSDYNTIGETGGAKTVSLAVGNLPQFTVTTPINIDNYTTSSGGTDHPYGTATGGGTANLTSNPVGSATPTPIDKRPPYFTLLKAYRTY